MAARLPSWAWVTGLTAGATAAVVALAVQADHGPHPTAAVASPGASASAGAHASTAPKPSAPAALPAASGQGRRIVYSVGGKRVWMVDATGKATRSFTVWPGTVSPEPGRYSITDRGQSPLKGSDGVEIEHIMYFARVSGVSIAFSNALDGSSPPPVNGRKLGGIRLHKEDGAALWSFGVKGTTVTVVR
ncbi:hypothetical protein AB0L59_22005 [Streptomyces sp. NPDC052109]|uniref:hypothetical protein n=1 Tax=Streptomyces sp. NPDC052109 TaxID=3155527 RepID=UPI003416D968